MVLLLVALAPGVLADAAAGFSGIRIGVRRHHRPTSERCVGNPQLIVSSPAWRHVSFLGVMSYSFYLLHQPIIEISMAAFDERFPQLNLHPLSRLAIAFAVYLPLFPVSYAFFRTIEKPSIKLGDRFWARVHSIQNVNSLPARQPSWSS